MKQVTFDINVNKEMLFKDMLELFKDEPVIGWLLNNYNPKLATPPMVAIAEAVAFITTDEAIDIPYINSNVIACTSRIQEGAATFMPKSGIQAWNVDMDSVGSVDIIIRCSAKLDDDGRIVKISSSPILERILLSSQEPLDISASKWESDYGYQDTKSLNKLSDEICSVVLTNFVVGAVAIDPRGSYPAITYLLMGGKCRSLSEQYMKESLTKAIKRGLISDKYETFV